MEAKVLKQIESAGTILEKELDHAGKVCKYCRYYGRNLDHPGFCPKINRVPARPHVTQCSFFDLRNATELIEILRAEEAERAKVIAIERAKVAGLARKAKHREHHKAEVGDPIDEPEINDIDSQDDVERFVQEASITND